MRKILAGYLTLFSLLIVIATMNTPSTKPSMKQQNEHVKVITFTQQKKLGNQEGIQSAYVKGEAENPSQFLEAFYQAGGKIYLSSKHGLFAERQQNGANTKVLKINQGFIFRQAGEDIQTLFSNNLPKQTQSIILAWPTKLWHSIEQDLRPGSTSIIYWVDNGAIKAKKTQEIYHE